MAQRPDAAKQGRWLELIRRWQRSQSTIREFCERHQVSEASFFSWRRILRERGLLDVLGDERHVAGYRAHEDLDQGYRDPEADTDDGGHERHGHPDESDQVDVHSSPPTGLAGGGGRVSTSELVW